MATVTGLTAERMLEIEAESIVDGNVDGTGHLILSRFDGTTIDAGYIVDQSALVDLVNDQTVAGEKTLSEKLSIELPVTGVGLRMGRAANLDSLNITPYGAAAVVMASGSEFDGVNSTARAASTGQIEMLNAGVNWYLDTGLVAGTQFARTKRMGLTTAGLLVSGVNHYFGPNAFGGAGNQLHVALTAATVQLIAEGSVADVDLYIQSKGAGVINFLPGGTAKGNLNTNGALALIGNDHYFGPGALGAAGGKVHLTADGVAAYVTGELTAGNGPLYLRSQGTGELKLQANATDIIRLINSGGIKLGFFGGAPVVKPAAAGSRAGNAALASLLTALAGLGLITDSTVV